MEEKIISVIVPVYNIERYVGQCVESIINQTYKNLDIVLVDDGSTDRSGALCDLYAKKDRRIRVIHKSNGGLVSARKAGIKIATGYYVGNVDGDDYLHKNFFKELYEAIESSEADLVVAGFSRVLFDSVQKLYGNIKVGVYTGESLDDLKSRFISDGEFYKNGITTYLWNKLFIREKLLDYQLSIENSISIGEDAAVVYPYIADCNKIAIIDNTDYHYRQREDSMLKTTKPFADEVVGLKLLYNFLITRLATFDCKKQIADYVLSICIIRSGGVTAEYMPYSKDFKNSNVIIYGAGTFGQQIYRRICESNYCNVVGWCDPDYNEYRRCCLDVDDLCDVLGLEYDYILIASVDGKQCKDYKKMLTEKGVVAEKIIAIDVCRSDRAEILRKYIG